MKINERQKIIYWNYVKAVTYIFTPIFATIMLVYGILALIPHYPFKHKDVNAGVFLIVLSLIIFPSFILSGIVGIILGLPILLIKSITNSEDYILFREPLLDLKK